MEERKITPFGENETITPGFQSEMTGREMLLEQDVIMPVLNKEAQIKGLKVYLFKDAELKDVYPNANPDVGIALLAKNEDSAKWNLQNLRRCYLVRL